MMLNAEIGNVQPIPSRLSGLNTLKREADIVSARLESVGLASRAKRIKDCGEAIKIASDKKGEFHQLRKARFCRVSACPICDAKWENKTSYQISRVMAQGKQSVRLIELSFNSVNANQLGAQLKLVKRQKQRLMQRKPFAKIKDHIALFRVSKSSGMLHVKLSIYYHDLAGKNYITKKQWEAHGLHAKLSEFHALKAKEVFHDAKHRSRRLSLMSLGPKEVSGYLSSVHKFRFVSASQGLQFESKPKLRSAKPSRQKKLDCNWYGWLPNPEDEEFLDEYLKLHDFDPGDHAKAIMESESITPPKQLVLFG